MILTRSARWSAFFFAWLPHSVLFAASLWITLAWRYPNGLDLVQWRIHGIFFGLIGLLWLLLFYAFGLLDIRTYARDKSTLPALTAALSLGTLTAIALFYFQPVFLITPRRVLLLDVLIVFVGCIGYHAVLRVLLKRTKQQTIVFVDLTSELSIQKTAWEQALSPHAICHTTHTNLLRTLESVPHPLLIVFPHTQPEYSPLITPLLRAHAQGTDIRSYASVYEELFRCVYPPNLTHWWFLEHARARRPSLYPFFKRTIDLGVGLLLIIPFLLTFPFIATLIWWHDRGPIFFAQTRVSKDGRLFSLYKYRTMKIGTATDIWTDAHDSRITPIGAWLRKTHLDELPQWLNIVRADMSLVGPRPEQATITDELTKHIPCFPLRHHIRPGLMGWAQLHIYASSEEESKQKLQYDLYYIQHYSFLFDLEIALKTIAHLIFLQGR